MDPTTVAYRLAKVGAAHRAAAGEELGRVGLHPGQEFLLGLLWEQDAQPIGRLAAALRVEPPTVTKMVTRLGDLGFVAREADPADGRVTLVRLTDAGRALEEPARAAWARLEERTTDGLDEQERAQLSSLLDVVRGSLVDGRRDDRG